MEKESVLFYLNRFREQRKPVDHAELAKRGAGYAERQRQVEEAEAELSPEQQALEVAIDAVNALPPSFRLPGTGLRLFDGG